MTELVEFHPGLETAGIHVSTDLTRYTAAKRGYPNGVTMFTDSGWLGNGFGSTVTKLAVLDGLIVGVYYSTNTSIGAVVLGSGSLSPDYIWSAGRRYTSKTRLTKFIAAVKALPRA